MLLPMKYEFCPNNTKIFSFHLSRLFQATVSYIKVASWIHGQFSGNIASVKSLESSYLG